MIAEGESRNSIEQDTARVLHYRMKLPEQEAREGCALLEGPMEKINERSLQRLLRELDQATLALALKGAGKKVQNKSPKLRLLLIPCHLFF